MQVHSTDGDRASTAKTAFSFCSTYLATMGENTDIHTKLNRPMNRKAKKATWNTLAFWFWRPRVLHSLTVLDRATGRPAVEMVRKKV